MSSGPAAMATAKPLLPPTPGSSSRIHHDEEYGGSRNKKRAKSIDVDEANQSDIARLSLYTPTTARGDGPRELICLCAKAPKVPRPRNAFILYRQAWQGHFAAQHPGLANPEISKLIGEKWREQPESVKNEWKQLAEEEKIRHQRQYPGYRYQPRRGGKNGSGRPTSSSGDTPGRCPKCGGRYIATPRTPTTPFGVASPPPSKRPQNMQPFMNNDHSRHGSISSGSGMSIDGHVRRYPQPALRDIEEDYPTMSPVAGPLSGIPPDAKRRRYNGPPVYVPGSPHMGYAPVDARYQQRPSVGGPPMSATGYGPGHLPRPPMPHRPGVYSGHPSHPSNPHMQPPPPPRQSMPYQPVSATPNRPNGGFDESLRLPPLQTQIHEPQTMNSEQSIRQGMPPTQPQQVYGTGLGIMNPGGGPARQPQLQPQPPPSAPPMPQKWPFLLKLEVLRSISPPLRPPGPGGPHFETRGPIIAVEGAPTPILKEVAAVIERALSVSAEFAVRVWSEDTSTAIAHSSPEPHARSGSNSSAEASGDIPNHGSSGNNNSIKGDPDNSGGGGGGSGSSSSNSGVGGMAMAAQKKTPALYISPIASYVARMLKWHKTSEDLVRYITSHPPPPPPPPPPQQQVAAIGGGSDGNGGGGGGAAHPRSNNTASSPPRLPIAILSDGYSLTFSDRYAGALHVNDAYRADDHWQWVATLWRGIVGADLTVYVKRTTTADEDRQGAGAGAGNNNSVEMAGPGIMVLRITDGVRVDEKLERRLGFEIAEWVRGGSFMAGFGNM
ncbi:hypothetical protein F5B21DRAFT_512812 [Xylaria acuta]|nr:hypothetical protein F5B21DRAFT_512812 [Xylaria acuta]